MWSCSGAGMVLRMIGSRSQEEPAEWKLKNGCFQTYGIQGALGCVAPSSLEDTRGPRQRKVPKQLSLLNSAVHLLFLATE